MAAGTARVRLAPLAHRHAEALQRIASDPRVGATTLLPEPYPEGGAAAFVAFARGEWGREYHFAIEASGEVVGMVGLKEIHDGQAEVGYYVDPERWGEGIASAAVRAACAYAFEALGLDRVAAHTLESNVASRRVLEKAGFGLVETVRNPFTKWAPEDRVARYVNARTR